VPHVPAHGGDLDARRGRRHPVRPDDAGHAQLESTAIYTHVSILKLLEVYAATHPAARIGQAPARAKARNEALARAEAADLLTALDDEAVEEDAVANATMET
jgi:hypothetical protein